MMWVFRLVAREIQVQRRQAGILLTILTLGTLGLLITNSLRSSAAEFMQLKSRDFLAADLVVRALRPFTEDEVRAAQTALRPLDITADIEFMSMARVADKTALIELKGVGPGFPLYGQLRVKSAEGSESARTAQELMGERIAWASSMTLTQLQAKIGDVIRVGQSDFRIAGEVTADVGSSRGNLGFTPRLYIGQNQVAATGLVQFGSQIFYRLSFKLPPSLNAETATSLVKAALPDPDIFVRTPADAVEGMDRFLQFFARYLSVLTFVVFSLSWIATFYILQMYVQQHVREAAVLMTLGASRWMASLPTFVQIIGLSLAAVLVSVIVTALGFGGVHQVFPQTLPTDFNLAVHWKDIGALSLIALASGVALGWPLWWKLREVRPRILLSESVQIPQLTHWGTQVVSYGVPFLFFAGLSFWLLDSASYALGLLGGLLAAIFVSWVLGRLFFVMGMRYLPIRGPSRLVWRNLAQGRWGVQLCFISLVLLSLILNIVPHLMLSVKDEMQPQATGVRSALFLFNIPQDRLPVLREFVEKQGGRLQYESPMILARWQKVNGQPPKEERFLKFPVRVSYRDGLLASEQVIRGSEIVGSYDSQKQKYPQLSLEVRFAERSKLKIGDILEFDVQGVAVEGQVVNLRRVRWTDFHPNFFIEFQPGVLDAAPKTWIANAELLKGGDIDVFQRALLQEFPDLSILDVGLTIQRILEVSGQMVTPMQVAAWTAVILSFVILLLVVQHNLQLRRFELDIQKILGADASLIKGMIVQEYAWLSGVAAVLGCVLGVILSAQIVWQVFDFAEKIDFRAALWSTLSVGFLTAGVAWLSARQVLAQSHSQQRL